MRRHYAVPQSGGFHEAGGVWIDLAFMIAGMLAAFLLCIVLFEWFRGEGLIKTTNESMHLAAGKTVSIGEPVKSENKESGRGDVKIFRLKENGFGYVGQDDTGLLKMEITAAKDATIKSLILDMNGRANKNDLVDLQLYFNKKFVATVPWFNGQAKFNDIKLPLRAGEKTVMEIKGTLSYDAKSNDRFQIGFAETDSIKIVDGDLQKLSIDGEIPFWGNLISVIGKKL